MEVKNILLSVVVVSWNTKQQTTECISSFYSIDDYNFLKDRCELILIDNDSKDGTCDEIKKNYPQVILIENSENKGYAPACNQGMRTATGKYILLLGSDTVLKMIHLSIALNIWKHILNAALQDADCFIPTEDFRAIAKHFPH
ncbi:MAG: glycosyltransferase [Ignavibacteria bacterium]|nr:glycosyltransferase [Ignavibacteria bacterium]